MKRTKEQEKIHNEQNKLYYRQRGYLTKKNYDLQLSFGISLNDYQNLLEKQNGVCAICYKEESSRRYKYLTVDHDHKTGRVRGLICSTCNLGLGKFKDNPEILANALKYLNGN